MRRRWIGLAVFLLVLLVAAALIALQTPVGRAAYNVADFRLRRWRIERWGRPTIVPEDRGTLRGRVSDPDDHPITGAVVLVAEATGETYYDYTDQEGRYEIKRVPPGRYVPLAAAWGYQMRTRPAVRVHPGKAVEHIDFTLPPRLPARPSANVPVTITGRSIVTGSFPAPDVRVERLEFHFTRGGIEVRGDRIYQPIGRTTPGLTLVMAFPSDEPHWEPAAIAFASQGFTVLHAVPAPERGMDIQAHAQDLLQAVVLLTSGRLTPAADPHRVAVLAGSFSTLYLYQALPDMPEVQAIITMGGVSDAFLGVRSLYTRELEIPERFQDAIAAIGRPDRDPQRFMQYSPAFFARHMPPTLVIHMVADRVIPVSQALRFEGALEEAGVRHELILYQDTSHYLNTWDPPEEVREAFRKMVAFLQETLSERVSTDTTKPLRH